MLLLTILLFCVVQPAFAFEYADPFAEESSIGEELKDEGGLVEKAVAGLINGIIILFEALEKALDLKTIDELVFNNGLDETQKKLLPFGEENWDKLNTLYKGMAACFSIFVLVAIVVTSVKIIAAGVSPRMRQEATESIWRWILAIVFIAAAPLIFWIVLNLNTYVVDGMMAVARDAAANIDDLAALRISGLSEDAGGDSSMAVQIRTGSVLGTALVKLMICGVSVYINMLYMVRKFALAVIFVFTPVMAWMWAINKNVNAAGIWFGELLSNAFMQTAHALVFLVYLTICTASKFGTQWLESVVWMMVIIPTAEMVRNSVQGLFTRLSGFDEVGAVGKVMGAVGLGSLAGIGGLAKATASSWTSADNTGSGGGGGGGAAQSVAGCVAEGGYTYTGSAASYGAGYDYTTSSMVGGWGNTYSGGGAAYNSAGAGNKTKPLSPAMDRAVNVGRTFGNVTAVTAGFMGKAMFAATPYSKEAQDFMGRAGGHIGGAVGRATGMAIVMLNEMQKERSQGKTTGETIRDIGGGGKFGEGVRNIGETTVKEIFYPSANDVYIPRAHAGKGVGNNIDDFRWR